MPAEAIRFKPINTNLIIKDSGEYDVIIQASQKDQSAFKKLFDKYSGKIYAFSLRLTMNTESAEEIVQETFIKAWNKLESFRFESKFSTWLFGIAYNEFLMHNRSKNKRDEKFVLADMNELLNIKTVFNFDTNIDIEKAISKLPEQAKAVFVLHEIEGYKHNEIAEMINIQEGTSKAHLNRARKILREELSK
ncbi:MAG TPA: RNA polymerase sigma factor [Ignavibacteria bacterium]|nr:RNA polymerase sigma factor [Ignavibacteria bacterium]